MSLLRAAAIAALGLLAGHTAAAKADGLPRLTTNEAYAQEAMQASTLAIDDPMAVFAFVLDSLPERVTVYPTENYYYFSFIDRHVRYAGNLRLDVLDRDAGKVHFAYYEDLAEWKEEPPVTHVILDRTVGVAVEKKAALVYEVSHAGRTVTFGLNDLTGVKPPEGVLGPDERYIGPVFDESAMRFFLIFNARLKIFHYVLDETVPVADRLIPSFATDRILIGARTGFAYYRDHTRERKILIGVFEGNSRINNYFDGPFDQLPDNFIEGETLRDALIAVQPDLKGRIDRFGSSADGADRYLIGPYAHYRTDDDLLVFHTCATSPAVPKDRYHACFVAEDPDDTGSPAGATHPVPQVKSTAPAQQPKTK